MRRAGTLHRGGRAEAVSKEDTAREANEDAAFRRKQMPTPVFEMGSNRRPQFGSSVGSKSFSIRESKNNCH
jgi:hypothetical protein